MKHDDIAKLKKIIREKENELNRLNNVEEMLNTVLSSIAGIHWWKDINGVYRGCNQAMVESLGLNSKNDIIGKTDYELPWSNQADILLKHDKVIIETGIIQQGKEEPVTTNDKKLHIFMVAKAPLHDSNGNIIGTVGNSIDITELKETQKKLEESKTREAHFKAMSSIGGMMAHELRTPLTSIALGAQNLKKYLPILVKSYREYSKVRDIEKIREYKLDDLDELPDNIEQSARYASNTISTILSGFHYSTSEVAPIERIDVGTVIQQALSEYPSTKEQEALISFTLEKSYEAMGAASIVIHVLHNLLKNAFYAIKEVGKGVITISLEPTEEGYILIRFKDTGKGMSEKVQQHIFEPFYTTKSSETSIGLGLYFCKMALEKMNSSITCHSEAGKYTTFDIKLNGAPKK